MTPLQTQIDGLIHRILALETQVLHLRDTVEQLSLGLGSAIDMLNNSVDAIETKLGIDGSDDPKSIDYRVSALERK